MPRKEKTETETETPQTVHPWAYPAYAASRSTKAGQACTNACAPVTRVVAVPVAIVGGFGWGLIRGTYDVLTTMPELPLDPALAAQLGLKPGQPVPAGIVDSMAQAVSQAQARDEAQAQAWADRFDAAAVAETARAQALREEIRQTNTLLADLVSQLTKPEPAPSVDGHSNGPAPAPAAA